MRHAHVLAAVAMLAFLASGCSSTRTYTQEDLTQVKMVYHELTPIYVSFVDAYNRADGAEVNRYFRLSHRPCALEDVVDKRDSMDPNINLFQASVYMDGFCNEIESAFARWRKDHHLPYDKVVVPSGTDPFGGYEQDLAKLPKMLKDPGKLG